MCFCISLLCSEWLDPESFSEWWLVFLCNHLQGWMVYVWYLELKVIYCIPYFTLTCLLRRCFMRFLDWNEFLDSCYRFRVQLPNHNKQRHGKSCSPNERWLMLHQEELRSRSQFVTVGVLNGILEEICGRWESWNRDITGKKRRRECFCCPAIHQHCVLTSVDFQQLALRSYTLSHTP